MTSFARWRLAWHGAGALLALLALLLLAPSAARASCGDYVTMGSSTAAHSASPSLPSDNRLGVPAVPRRHGPCHGPFCSGNPLPAPLAPVPPAPVHGDQWAHLCGLLLVAPADTANPVSMDDSRTPVRHGLLVYHPPR
jgi:hypothetical protein